MKNSNIKIYGGFIDYVAGTMNIYEYDGVVLEDGMIKLPYYVPFSMIYTSCCLDRCNMGVMLPLLDDKTRFVIYHTDKDFVRDCLQKSLNNKLCDMREKLKKLENMKTINELRAADVLKAKGIA